MGITYSSNTGWEREFVDEAGWCLPVKLKPEWFPQQGNYFVIANWFGIKLDYIRLKREKEIVPRELTKN